MSEPTPACYSPYLLRDKSIVPSRDERKAFETPLSREKDTSLVTCVWNPDRPLLVTAALVDASRLVAELRQPDTSGPAIYRSARTLVDARYCLFDEPSFVSSVAIHVLSS